jgi:hypothetical protein
MLRILRRINEVIESSALFCVNIEVLVSGLRLGSLHACQRAGPIYRYL